MPTSSSTPAGSDPTLRLQKSAHLRRLARFALVDDVPSPWGVAGERLGVSELDARRTEKE